MTIDIKVPIFPESISEGTLVSWHYQPGDQVTRESPLASIETEKVVIEIPAPVHGSLVAISKQEGETVFSEEILGQFLPDAAGSKKNESVVSKRSKATEPKQLSVNPAARRLAEEANIDLSSIQGTGKSGRITKDDVIKARDEQSSEIAAPKASQFSAPLPEGERLERRVTMTRLRSRIAQRLLEAQHNAAMLTTVNEVDMSVIIALRKNYQDEFQKAHEGTKLGFMSFFVLASVEALKKFPMVNASIDGNEIVYHGYYDLGIAVGTEAGLVVPVIKNADSLELDQIEEAIKLFSEKARNSKLTLEDLSGGTFTISNGGIYGSLLSTPILNPPQTAILGMHKIQQRPMVIDDEIQIRPMMYLALSYDHRLIDGSEAVRFLVAIKELLEDPIKALLKI